MILFVENLVDKSQKIRRRMRKMMDIMWPISQITLSCILFVFIEIKFIHCHSSVMFAMKSMSMCNN